MITSVDQALAILDNNNLTTVEREMAGHYLRTHPDNKAISRLVKALQDDDSGVAWSAAEALSRECVGALVAIQRDVALAPYVETGERIDGEVTPALIRTIFSKNSPLHDGAVILAQGRIIAAGCQLPMRPHHERINDSGQPPRFGMRHRAALALSEETDAIILVISEETGRISLACGGRFEPVPRENLARRLVDMLHSPAERKAA